MSKCEITDPYMISIPSASVKGMEIDRRWHIYVNGRELPECETYAWFEAAINEKAAKERLDENGLARCGCGGEAILREVHIVHSGNCSVGCSKCGVRTEWLSKDQAIKVWNTARGYKEDA